MGFENEVEQSYGRPYRQGNGRSKRTHELTSSIVPRGTSFHRWVELECSPIACGAVRLSCHCGLPGPLELGAINPYAVHDHGQRFTPLSTTSAQAVSCPTGLSLLTIIGKQRYTSIESFVVPNRATFRSRLLRSTRLPSIAKRLKPSV